MRIIIDGIIYNLKKTGGIKRYFDGFIPYLNKDNNLKVKLILTSDYFQLPIPIPKTIFKSLLEPVNKYLKQKYFSNIKADIFHSTYYTRLPNQDISQVITVYDMIHEKFPQYFKGKNHDDFRKQKKDAVEKADAVICISQNTKKDLLKYFELDKKKVFIIYPGIDTSIFKPIKSFKIRKQFFNKYKIKLPYLLYVGPRGRYKNFLSLVKAFAGWKKRSDFNLITIGGPKFTKKEKLLFNNLAINRKVYNYANVSDKDLVLFYNYAHVFVYPSLYEGFGIPVLEAMTSSTLVLSSDKASMPEVGGDGPIYFDPKNKSSIIDALNKSLNAKKRFKHINNGLKRVKKFSWEKTAKETLNVYQNIYKSF